MQQHFVDAKLAIGVGPSNPTQNVMQVADIVFRRTTSDSVETISQIGQIVVEARDSQVVRATLFPDNVEAYRYCLRLIWGRVDFPVTENNTTGDSEVDLNSINNAFNEEFSSNEEFLKVMRENGVLMDLQRSDRDV